MNKLIRPALFAILFLVVFGFQLSCVDHNFPSYVCPDTEVSCLGADRDWSNFATFQENAQHGSVKNFVTNRIMPPSFSSNGPLSQDQINTIACWVDDGAQNN
jgi:hypothetical protein